MCRIADRINSNEQVGKRDKSGPHYTGLFQFHGSIFQFSPNRSTCALFLLNSCATNSSKLFDSTYLARITGGERHKSVTRSPSRRHGRRSGRCVLLFANWRTSVPNRKLDITRGWTGEFAREAHADDGGSATIVPWTLQRIARNRAVGQIGVLILSEGSRAIEVGFQLEHSGQCPGTNM